MISSGNCVNTEMNNLAWYFNHIRGNIISKLRDLGTINTTEAVAPNENKNKVKGDLEKQ